MSQPNDLRITVDGVQYPVTNLPADIQQIFYIYQEWDQDLTGARKEVFKLESAIRAVSAEIEARIRQHASEQKAALEQLTAAPPAGGLVTS